MLAAVGGHHPALLHAHELRYFQTDLVYVKLIQRQITFGNANRLMNESYLEFWQRIVAYDRARSDAERRQQAEENRRLADQARRLGENFEQVRGVVL